MRINRRQTIVYPCLFAIYPLLNLYVTNIHKPPFSAMVKPLLLILGAILVLYLAANWILKASTSAGILTTAIVVAVLYYGAFYNVVGNVGTVGATVQRHLLPVWVVLFVLICTLAVRKRVASAQVNAYLNFLSATIIGVVLVSGVVSFVRGTTSNLSPARATSSPAQGRSLNARIELDALPDVYYIILDGYGRADVLLDYYNFDNSVFINSLTSKGFYVAPESRSNYSQTAMSLPTSLNVDYPDTLGVLEDRLSTPQKTRLLRSLVQNNYVIRQFNDMGYTTINLDSGFSFFTSNNKQVDISYRFRGVDEFTEHLLETTILKALFPTFIQKSRRQGVLAIFDKLKKVSQIESPTFTFSHVPVPHPPFIFDRQGNFTGVTGYEGVCGNGWLPQQAYVDQILYLNHLVEDLVDTILAESETPPIIVLQGDHGPMSAWMRSRETLSILNAYYLPGGGEQYLYPSITPVNSFRLIFDVYFGTNLGLLEDLSYLSNYQFKYDLVRESDNIFPDDSDPEIWMVSATKMLKEHKHRLSMEYCDIEKFLLINDGFFDLERSAGQYFRWAGPTLNLQLPIERANQDYIFRAGVNHILSDENQEIRLLVDGELIDSAVVSPGAQEITLIVPARQTRSEEPFIRVQIKHSKVYDISPRKLSLMYHWIEWASLIEAKVFSSRNGEDIVTDNGIFLGGGWYSLERYEGETFRWVNNDAEIVVTAPGEPPEISLTMQSGPGLNAQPFELQVLDESGQVVATAEVEGRETVEVALPLNVGETRRFRLHVEGGGQQAAPNDSRILNFRVFRLGWSKPLYEDVQALLALNADRDIVPPSDTQELYQNNRLPADGLFIGHGWYPLETFDGETFRWVDNDAEIVVTEPSGTRERLRLEVAPGPGLSAQPFELQVLDESGQVVATAEVEGRETIEVALPLVAGKGQIFRLHVEGGGQQAASNRDPRILNFRVFRLGW
jgi:hypothetical protein